MSVILLSFFTFISTLLGGLVAFKNRERLHYIMSFTAGILIAVSFFDIMPEIFSLTIEKGFDPIDALDQNNFYQILSDGKLRLLMDTKFATETKQVYGTGAVTTTDKLVNFYAASGTKVYKITKEEQILSIMSDKAAEITAFIKIFSINIKAKLIVVYMI